MEQAQSLRDIMNKRKDASVQVITVTSAKGGVGKTSVSINLAIALSRRGRRVLLVDMDVGLANIDLMLGEKSRYNLSDLLSGNMQVSDIIETSRYGVQFISGGSGLSELINIQPHMLHRIISNLLNLHDVADTLIFDTGSGISDHIVRLICASHVTWLVTTPEPTAIMDAYALVKQVNGEKARPNIQLILNKTDNQREANASLNGFVQITQKYTDVNIARLGYILRDNHMVTAVKRQEPLLVSFPNCMVAKNFERLADQFLQGSPIQNSGFSAFLERFLDKSVNE